jgi:glycosyltransferase involved in cell wall biosynthesis
MREIRLLWDVARGQACRVFPNSYLAVIGDGAGWSLDDDALQIARILRRSDVKARETTYPWPRQAAFFASRDAALHQMERWRRWQVSVCFPYYHGYPGRGERSFDVAYALLRREHEHVARIQVTNPEMRALILETGIADQKVHTILIGVDAAAFSPPTPEQRAAVRTHFGIPHTAVVVGSFQKDGDGWGEGLEPKHIKGPDVLLNALVLVKRTIPELFVLLSGPARGFVRRGLASAGIPHRHTLAASHAGVPPLFHALDAYIVASREEGGPKAILESMASGVPIISTRVGQAPALIRHGENGWLADVGDAEALAYFTQKSLVGDWVSAYRPLARRTAEDNDYLTQAPQWLAFFDGLVARGGRTS